MSQVAIQARKDAEMYSARNTAVFEYQTPSGPSTASAFSERGVGHAERNVWRDLQSSGVPPMT